MAIPAIPAHGANWDSWAAGIDSAARGAATKSGDNVFTGNQQINGGIGLNAAPDPKSPANFTTTFDGPTVRASGSTADKVSNQINTVITGDFAGDTGPNPGFVWGQNVFTLVGSAAGDGNGLTNVTASLIEAHVATPAGTTIGNLTGLEVDTSFWGASAGAHVGIMQSLYIRAPSRSGGTGGSVDNAYTLVVEGLDADGSAVGASSALSMWVTKGVCRFEGRLDVQNTITATDPNGLNLIGALGAPAAALALGPAATGGHAQIKLGAGGSVFALTNSGGTNVLLVGGSGDLNLKGGLGLFGTSAVSAKPSVTGSRGGNAALASLLTALASYGLLTDSTTA